MVFSGNRAGISCRQESFVVGEGERNLPWRIFLTASLVSFLKNLQGTKEGGGNRNISVLWPIMLFLT